jgi:hypothetical protein
MECFSNISQIINTYKVRGGVTLKRVVHSNTLPFFILLIIHTALLIYTFCKNKNRKSLFILLLSNIGFAYFFEFFILNLFHSYEYKPNLFKKRYLDNILGAFLSQGVFVPFTSIFISSFGFGWKIKAMFTIYFAIVERIFIKLGIFKNNWWRTIYTVFLIPLYFKISENWYKSLLKGNGNILFTSFLLMTWVSGLSLLNILGVFQKVRFGLGKFYSWREHFIISTLYWFTISIFTTCTIYQKPNWQGKIQSFLFMKVVDWFLIKMGIIKFHLNHLLFMNGLQILMLYLSVIYKNLIYRGQYAISEEPQLQKIVNSTNT